MSGNFNENADALPPGNGRSFAPRRLLGCVAVGLLIAGIVTLGWLSFTLAASRIYQVDECLNVYVAHLIASRQSAPGMELFQLILSWLIPAGARAVDMYASARLVTWLIFWLNLILLALATGEKIFSRRWLVALAGAATLAPLWDYGFEIRHDNLLLSGILLMWGVVRFQPPRLGTYFFLGACFIGVEFISVKGILYTFPLLLGVMVFPPSGERPARWKLFAATCIGALLTFFALRFIFKVAGLGQDYLANVKGVAAVPTGTFRFSPLGITLSRLLVQTPLLVALAVGGVIACVATVVRGKPAALNWDGLLPEVLLLGAALTALFVNPNPYPYNLIHVAPYAFLLAFRYGTLVWKQIPTLTILGPIALSIVLFTHLVPFATATQRHWAMPNFAQERLMTLTEDLTDPEKDFVFDGISMVPTRKPCDVRTFIHGQSYLGLAKNSAEGMQLRGFIAANPPSVVILSYRTEWMSDEDKEFLNQRYVSLSDDFMVLGTQLPVGGGTFEIYHAGRYRITVAEGSNIIGTYPEPKTIREAIATPIEPPPLAGTIDGTLLDGQPVQLSVGTHRIECAADHQPAVVWVGPHLDKVPRAPGGDRHRLFVNWY